MLTKKETLDTIKKALNLYKTNVLDNVYAKTEYVDSKALPVILINDENKTGPALFPLLPEHNLVFIAGDAQIPDSTGAITTIYGLCYSDLQNDGSKLITEYRTGKAAKVNSNGVLESFEYIDTNVKSIVSNIKGGTINKVLAKNSDTDFDYKWVDMPSIETFKKYVDDTANTLVKKDTNKYILITNDDTLIIKKDSITDIANATITIDNLTGQFGTLVANDNGTYSYTLNTIMTDVETFTFKVNNVEQKLVIVPYKEMTYDNKNAGITYEGNWYEDTNDKYYKKSSRYTKGSDNSTSKLSFVFTGTAVKFIGMTSKALGKNRTLTSIYKINNDAIDAEASYASVSSNTITSTDNIMYNSCVARAEFFNQIGFSKCKAELASGKGSTSYIDRIIIYNTIQNLNDSIESLYNQRESMSNVLRTDIPNGVFEPKELYDPATKYYVDKTVAAGKIAMCTDEEVNNMLNEVLGGDYSGN